MYALLAALVLAQSSVNISLGGKITDSTKAEMRKRVDSLRLRREERLDSIMSAHDRGGDSADIARRRAKQIKLTPALLANAFRNPRAKVLLAAARDARARNPWPLCH
jgi:glutamine synthetase adenylyltransferase